MIRQLRLWSGYLSDLWQQHRGLIIFLMIALLFDTLTTIHFMTHHGIYLETHPLVRSAALMMGPVVGTVLTAFLYKIITCLFLAVYLRHVRLWVLVLPSLTAILAGFINLFG